MRNLVLTLASVFVLAFIFTSCEKQTIEPMGAFELNNGINNDTEETAQSKPGCTTIQSGTLVDSEGETIVPGYNEWGHNYQARKFNGYYCDSYRDAAWCQPYKDVKLSMKWNDAWLSNQDCDGDGLLDRHYGHPSYLGSGAWLTNHQSGEYIGPDGNTCKWNYFVKIVAAPADGTKSGGKWYNADGSEIGEVIWNDFAIIQSVYNDPCGGQTGLEANSPDRSGLGGR